MTRLGLSCPFLHVFGADDYLKFVREAEERGYHTAWIGETVGSDAIATMTLVLSATTRLAVASGVLPLQTRTPTVLAMAAATLARIAPGRVGLGIGLSSPVIVGDWNGLRYSSSLDQLREAVHIVRGFVAGERVSFEGKFYRVRNLRSLAPPPSSPPKVILAALGPRALELAGEIADGVLLNWCTPERVAEARGAIREAAVAAGRPADAVTIAVYVRASFSDRADEALLASASEYVGYASYARQFERMGVEPTPEAVVEAVCLRGDPEAARERLDAYRAAGADLPVVYPALAPGEDARASFATLRALAPVT